MLIMLRHLLRTDSIVINSNVNNMNVTNSLAKSILEYLNQISIDEKEKEMNGVGISIYHI